MTDEGQKGPKTEALERASERDLDRVVLTVVEGADDGERFTLDDDRIVIGTHASADVVLSDPSVSRFHLEVRATTGSVVLRDLGSTNGTRVDGVAVIEAPVTPGSTI